MLYVRKDLASKYTDWRGVERGPKGDPPNVSSSKNHSLRSGFSAADSRFAQARTTPQLRLSKSTENNFGAASRFVLVDGWASRCANQGNSVALAWWNGL
jgi:hypothetical protein